MVHSGIQTSSHETAREKRLELILLVLACAIVISPAWLVRFPAMPDYPNYLARLSLIAANGSPEANPFYEVVWRPISNLAFDLLVPPLAAMMSVPLATKVVFVASECLVVVGATALEISAKGRHEIAGFAALACLYCFPFAIGLLNFELGVGLALWGIACWLRLGQKSPVTRYAAHWLFTGALFAAHLFALGIYGLTLGLLEAHAIRQRGRLTRGDLFNVAMLAFPAAVLLALTRLFGGALGGTGGSEWLPSGKVLWVVSFLNGYSIVLSAGGLAAIVVLLLVLRTRKAVALTAPGVWVGAGCLIVYLLMPIRLSGSYFVDVRMVLAMALVVPAFICFTPGADSPARWSTIAVLLAIAAASTAVTLQTWRGYQHDYAQMLASFDRLDRASRVLVAEPDDAGGIGFLGNPLRHAPTLAAAHAGALVPSLFAIRGSQPIRLREAYRDYDVMEAGMFDPVPISVLGKAAHGELNVQALPAIARWRETFDYLYVLGAPGANPFPAFLSRVEAGDRFALYRVGKRVEQRDDSRPQSDSR